MESTPTKHVYSGQKEKTDRLEEMAFLMHHCTKKHLRGERDSRQSHCFFVLWRMLATFVVQKKAVTKHFCMKLCSAVVVETKK